MEVWDGPTQAATPLNRARKGGGMGEGEVGQLPAQMLSGFSAVHGSGGSGLEVSLEGLGGDPLAWHDSLGYRDAAEGLE